MIATQYTSQLLTLYDQKISSGAVKPDAEQKSAILALDKFCHDIGQQKKSLIGRIFLRAPQHRPLGFYLHGDVGRGKTMVMDLFFAAAPIQKKRRVHFHAFMLEVHDFLHARRMAQAGGTAIDDSLLSCADKISRETRLLCLDEFHVRDVADAMILGRLFTALFSHGVCVVMTSNATPDDLYKDGLQRDRFLPFIALLKEKLTLLRFNGDTDYRLNRLRAARSYYWPDDADARHEMQKLFLDMADGTPIQQEEIVVKDRPIKIPAAARDSAWFTFNELCDTPKSAVDYLTLAQRYRIFFIESVPRLDDGRHNAALRFITAIDALYDARARAVISAAVAPANLYTGDLHAHAFARTVSRLMEMQSKEYGTL